MINILMGPPGAGKSYEAVVYHILVALNRGRKVITNMPVNPGEFDKFCPGSSELIELRHATIDNPRPFSSIEDYGHSWRGVGGIGPLYVIDECHKSLAKGGTSRLVEEWYAEHRHEGADVLLITQGYGKISQAIRDMVQMVYRVRKATALGSDKRYARKVQDGLRGEVVNETVRSYDASMFCLYKSHTKSSEAVHESGASDVKPIWQHWSFVGAALLIPVAVVILVSIGNPFMPDQTEHLEVFAEPVKSFSGPLSVPKVKPVAVDSVAPITAVVPVPRAEKPDHPFKGLQLHLSAFISGESGRSMYSISASQNGQRVFRMTDSELVTAGYDFSGKTPCLAQIAFGEYSAYLTCNSPSAAVPLG